MQKIPVVAIFVAREDSRPLVVYNQFTSFWSLLKPIVNKSYVQNTLQDYCFYLFSRKIIVEILKSWL